MNMRSTPPVAQYGPLMPSALTSNLKPISLGFLSHHNPHDKTAFSGTVHAAAKALGKVPGVAMKVLGNHRPPKFSDRILPRKAAEPDLSDLDLSGLDAIVSMVSTPLLDQLAQRTRLPFLHVTDATPSFLRQAYGWDIPAEADAAEARVVSQAAAVVYSSNFMAQRAQEDFGNTLSPFVAPFGVNFDKVPDICPKKPSLGRRIELLFVCSDWDRKGGPTALATLDTLIASGAKARLTVVGRMPDACKRHPNVRFAGFLDKNRPRAAARLAALYQRAHILLAPSKADCTPMVLAEAMAHGTPVLASDTGGMAEAINTATEMVGRTLPASADPSIWAAEVWGLTADPATYRMVSQGAFAHSRVQLSWQSWGETISSIARTTLLQAARAA